MRMMPAAICAHPPDAPNRVKERRSLNELYSEEHRRKFTTEEAGFQVVKDPKDKSKLALAINGQVIGEWFKEQFGRLFSSVKRTVEPLRRGKGMGL